MQVFSQDAFYFFLPPDEMAWTPISPLLLCSVFVSSLVYLLFLSHVDFSRFVDFLGLDPFVFKILVFLVCLLLFPFWL